VKALVLAIISAAALGGCASVPMANADLDARAKTFVAPGAGHATLYVYRSETFGGAIKLSVLLDNVAIGDTGPHTFIMRDIAPGKHTLVSKSEKDVSLDFDAQDGQTYYVWQEVKMGVWAARSQLHVEDAKTAQEAIRDCKLVQ
jgi:Protein of unknown function (DUF2846)